MLFRTHKAIYDSGIRVGNLPSDISAATTLSLDTAGHGNSFEEAVLAGNLKAVKSLIENGTDVNIVFQGGQYGNAL